MNKQKFKDIVMHSVHITGCDKYLDDQHISMLQDSLFLCVKMYKEKEMSHTSMARLEDISEACPSYMKKDSPERHAFENGARWADKYPSVETMNKVVDLYDDWDPEKDGPNWSDYVIKHWEEDEEV